METTIHSPLSTFTLLDHSSEEPSQDGGSEESITHISTQKTGPVNRSKTEKTKRRPPKRKRPRRNSLRKRRKPKKKKNSKKRLRRRKTRKPRRPKPKNNELLNQIYDSNI